MNKNHIDIYYDPPPIPDRNFDWHAVRHASYEAGMPFGHGPTPQAALESLLEQEDVCS